MQANQIARRGRLAIPAHVRVWAFNGVLTVIAALLYGPATHGGSAPEWPGFGIDAWFLVLLFAVVEIVTIKLVFRREGSHITFNEVPLIVGLFFASPATLVLTRCVGVIIGLGLVRRQRPLKLVFNVVHMTIETTLALIVLRALTPSIAEFGLPVFVAVLASTAATVVVDAATLTPVIALYEGLPPVRTWFASFVPHLLAAVTNATLALTLVVVISADAAAAWMLLAPTVVLLVAYRTLTLSRDKQRGLEFLYEASRLLHRGEALAEPIHDLLQLTRDTFHAEVAELILHSDVERDRGLRTAVGPGTEVRRMEPVDLAELDRTVRPGAAMVSTLDGEHRRLGTLLVAGPSQAQGRFTQRQLQLFTTLVNNVTLALENGLLEASLAEVTALKDEMHHQAFHDPLTGLGNRALFGNELERALRDRSPTASLAVIFIDVDDFKTVNDVLGHAAGDALLSRIADCLRRSLRPGEVAGRLGGDEFAILLERLTSDEDATRVAERLLEALAEPFFVNGQRIVIGASLGIAVTSGPLGTAPDDLMRDADLAMYAAKSSGKCRFAVFEPPMRNAVVHRSAVSQDFERALEQHEFVVHYQPIVDLRTDTVVGTEALVRWDHPERGLIPPAEFIPTAEELGFIDRIGRVVLTTAADQLAMWQQEYPRRTPLTVSVNVSALEFERSDFAERTISAVHEAGIAAGSLIVEITESAMVDSASIRDKLRALRTAGLVVAVDDFGTGYSSLSYLEDLAIDILKVPKTFVDGLARERNRPALAVAIVQLARTLSLEVVAEGVESREQAVELQQLGCRLGQGFAFSRPLEPAALGDLFERGLGELPRALHGNRGASGGGDVAARVVVSSTGPSERD